MKEYRTMKYNFLKVEIHIVLIKTMVEFWSYGIDCLVVFNILKSKYNFFRNKTSTLKKGTFEAERKCEKIAYGLVHPNETFDPIYIQVFIVDFILNKCKYILSTIYRCSIIEI